jgi:hypothetical protein
MALPEIVLLDGVDRYFRAAVLKARGYRVFITEHVVEVCLHWVPGTSAALVIGPQVQWQSVATLCDWIKINSPEKPIILLSDRPGTRWRAHVDAVIPTQPVQILAECLRDMLPISEPLCHSEAVAQPSRRVRHSLAVRFSCRD